MKKPNLTIHCAGCATRSDTLLVLLLLVLLLLLVFLLNSIPLPVSSGDGTRARDQANQHKHICTTVSMCDEDEAGASNGRDPNLSSAYLAIRKFKNRSLASPVLNGGDSPTFSYGSFREGGDNRTSLAFERHVFERKSNVTLSFDPKSMQCVLCLSRGPHDVVNCADRSVFVLSDQSFPAVLPSTTGKDCVKIVRVENGSLWDLVNTFLDVTRGHSIPKGSLIVLSSAVHLADVGTACYVSDLQKSIGKLSSVYRGGVVVLPGVSVCLGGTDDPSLVRSLAELYTWLSGGQSESSSLSACYILALEMLSDNCHLASGIQTEYVSRIVLPVSLSATGFKKWVSAGWGSLPCKLLPLDQKSETKIIDCFLNELNKNYDLDLEVNVSLSRGLDAPAHDQPLNILVVGASHASRLAVQLDLLGHNVTQITHPGWRATRDKVNKMTEEVMTAASELSADTLVIFWLYDNSLYFARTEEGGFIPIRRAVDGTYHVDGDLMLAPVEVSKQVIDNCMPIIAAGGTRPKIIISPLARYTNAGCCGDLDHAANTSDDDFTATLLAQLDQLRANVKEFCFRGGIRKAKYLNFSKMAVSGDEEDHWLADPVHPTSAVYSKAALEVIMAAKHLSEGQFKKGAKRKLSVTGPSEASSDWAPICIDMPGSRRHRPGWVTDDSAFANCNEGQRGRGRGRFGSRGRRGRYSY